MLLDTWLRKLILCSTFAISFPVSATPDLSFLDTLFTDHLLVANSTLSAQEKVSQPVAMWGGSFTIAKDGVIVYEKAFGSADATSTPVTTSSTFRLASIHKAITAIGIMKLVQDNLISLDDTVFGPSGILNHSVYYDGIDIYDPNEVDPRVLTITVGHLLSHRSGWSGSDTGWFPFEMRTVRQQLQSNGLSVPTDIVDQMIKLSIITPLSTDPGLGSDPADTNKCTTRSSGFSYNNTGPQIAGKIIEKVSGQTLENFFNTNIFSKAGTTEIHESVSWQSAQPLNEVYFFHPAGGTKLPYNTDNPSDVPVPVQYGGFPVERTWSASSRALVKLLLALELPDSDPNNILTIDTMKQMLVPPTVSTPGVTHLTGRSLVDGCETFDYAFGWGRGAVNDMDEYHWMIDGNWSHNGGMPGSMSIMRRDQYGYTYAAVVNVTSNVPSESTESLMDSAIKQIRALEENDCPTIKTGGMSGTFGTTDAYCFKTQDSVTGWGVSNFNGRTISVTVNGLGTAVSTPGAALPAKGAGDYYHFESTAGAYDWASIWWW